MTFTKTEQTLLYNALRQFLYFAANFAMIYLIYILAKHFHELTFDEHGIIENIQLALLLISGLIFITQAYKSPEYRIVSLLLASYCLLASCRELDKFFDSVLPVISWKFGFLFPLAALYNAFKNSRKFIKTVLQFTAFPSFYMMCFAVTLVIPIAQCIGHRPFVAAVLGEYNIADIKEFFEESCETMGYLMITMSAIEYRLNIKNKKALV